MPTEGCLGVPCETSLGCPAVTPGWWVCSLASSAQGGCTTTRANTGSGCAMGSSLGGWDSRKQPVLLQDGAQTESCGKRTEIPLKGPWPRHGWEGSVSKSSSCFLSWWISSCQQRRGPGQSGKVRFLRGTSRDSQGPPWCPAVASAPCSCSAQGLPKETSLLSWQQQMESCHQGKGAE